jgi:His/Glu/Gln/Arg/opine family amino acid ABC transporter permease subunit
VLGLGVELLRRSPSRLLAALIRGLVEVLRGIPPIALLFIVYFGLVEFGFKLGSLPAGVLCLGLIEAAYSAEIYRAGIDSVHHGQREAALSIGLTPLATMRHVVLPQAFPRVIPPLTNQLVGLLKVSAAVSLIAIPELTFEAQAVAGMTFQGLEVFGLAMLLYLAMGLPISWLAKQLERTQRRLA